MSGVVRQKPVHPDGYCPTVVLEILGARGGTYFPRFASSVSRTSSGRRSGCNSGRGGDAPISRRTISQVLRGWREGIEPDLSFSQMTEGSTYDFQTYFAASVRRCRLERGGESFHRV